MTGKRLILAQAQRNHDGVKYKSWNMLFKDILMFYVILLDTKTEK